MSDPQALGVEAERGSLARFAPSLLGGLAETSIRTQKRIDGTGGCRYPVAPDLPRTRVWSMRTILNKTALKRFPGT